MVYKRSDPAVRYPVTSDSSLRTATASKMFLKTFALLPVVFCLVTAVRLNSRPGVGPSLLERDSFGDGKHSDARKITRSSVDPKKSVAVSPSAVQGKSSENKPGYSQFPENDSLDVASWNSEVTSSAPAYGSVGTAGQGSSGRSFGGHQGGSGGFGPSSFGNAGFGKIGGGAGGYGGQGGSFGGSQSGYNGGSQGGSFGGSQSGYNGGSQGGYGNNAEPGMPYRFQYNVNEYGNNFGHSQASDGNQVTGRYFVQLPDGRLQTVDFKADPFSGYTADVQYEGQAQYPSNSGSGGYSSGSHSTNSGGYGSVGGGSLGQLPLALHGQGDFGGALPSGGYSSPGSFNSKPY